MFRYTNAIATALRTNDKEFFINNVLYGDVAIHEFLSARQRDPNLLSWVRVSPNTYNNILGEILMIYGTVQGCLNTISNSMQCNIDNLNTDILSDLFRYRPTADHSLQERVNFYQAYYKILMSLKPESVVKVFIPLLEEYIPMENHVVDDTTVAHEFIESLALLFSVDAEFANNEIPNCHLLKCFSATVIAYKNIKSSDIKKVLDYLMHVGVQFSKNARKIIFSLEVF